MTRSFFLKPEEMRKFINSIADIKKEIIVQGCLDKTFRLRRLMDYFSMDEIVSIAKQKNQIGEFYLGLIGLSTDEMIKCILSDEDTEALRRNLSICIQTIHTHVEQDKQYMLLVKIRHLILIKKRYDLLDLLGDKKNGFDGICDYLNPIFSLEDIIKAYQEKELSFEKMLIMIKMRQDIENFYIHLIKKDAILSDQETQHIFKTILNYADLDFIKRSIGIWVVEIKKLEKNDKKLILNTIRPLIKKEKSQFYHLVNGVDLVDFEEKKPSARLKFLDLPSFFQRIKNSITEDTKEKKQEEQREKVTDTVFDLL